MRVIVVNHSRKDMCVHAEGCRDVTRDRKRGLHNSDWVLEVPKDKTVKQAVVDDLNAGFGWTPADDEPAPWSDNDITVFPCVKVVR